MGEDREVRQSQARLSGARFSISRSARGIELGFPVLRASGAAISLLVFAVLCGVMPAVGLSALLSLDSGGAAAAVSLALIGGLAAPFIVASVVFLVLAIYLQVNALHVTIDQNGIRSERRIFGRVIARHEMARGDIADIEPRIGARYQNLFSSLPRYALIAKHHAVRSKDMVIAEDLAGQQQMIDLRAVIEDALGRERDAKPSWSTSHKII